MFLNTFPCLTLSTCRLDSGLSEENVNCGLIGQLNFTPSWLVEEEPLLLLKTHLSTWIVNLTSSETSMPASSVSHSLLAVLLQQTNVSLSHNNKKPNLHLVLYFIKPNLHLVLYFLLATSPSICFALQLQRKTRLFSSSRLGPDSSGLAFISCHSPLPCPGHPAAVPGSLLPHQNLTWIASPKMLLTITNQARDSHLCWQNIFKIDFSKATARYDFFFIYLCAVHFLFLVGSCLKVSCIVCLGSDIFYALKFHQPLAGIV